MIAIELAAAAAAVENTAVTIVAEPWVEDWQVAVAVEVVNAIDSAFVQLMEQEVVLFPLLPCIVAELEEELVAVHVLAVACSSSYCCLDFLHIRAPVQAINRPCCCWIGIADAC